MRIIDMANPGPKPKMPEGVKEVEATCTNCTKTFGFTLLDEGVFLDNERDYNVDCPACGTELSIGSVTGIVLQRKTGD